MNSVALFCFSLALLFSGGHMVTVTIRNNCPTTIWPATLTSDNKPQLSTTGFVLASKKSKSIDVGTKWKGRFWARTQCTTDSSGKFSCQTGDCATGKVSCDGKGGKPPVTLCEINVVGNNGKDNYDISLVDGFNLPASLTPQGGSSNCVAPKCSANINAVCPQELAVKGDGTTVACKSACLKFNQPKYCCTPPNNSSSTCGPTPYSKIFKDKCPQAYSYAFDDPTSLFTCSGVKNYEIVFCP